jgi:hypothetical protein
MPTYRHTAALSAEVMISMTRRIKRNGVDAGFGQVAGDSRLALLRGE